MNSPILNSFFLPKQALPQLLSRGYGASFWIVVLLAYFIPQSVRSAGFTFLPGYSWVNISFGGTATPSSLITSAFVWVILLFALRASVLWVVELIGGRTSGQKISVALVWAGLPLIASTLLNALAALFAAPVLHYIAWGAVALYLVNLCRYISAAAEVGIGAAIGVVLISIVLLYLLAWVFTLVVISVVSVL